MLIQRSIYGFIQASLLWYNMYTDRVKALGFKVNPDFDGLILVYLK